MSDATAVVAHPRRHHFLRMFSGNPYRGLRQKLFCGIFKAMLPRPARAHSPGNTAAYSKESRQFRRLRTQRIKVSHLANLVFVELRVEVSASCRAKCSSLRNHVCNIFRIRALEKVPGIHATRIVTSVTYLQVGPKIVEMHLVRKSVCSNHLSTVSERTVPISIGVCRPQPARTKLRSYYRSILVHFRPIPFRLVIGEDHSCQLVLHGYFAPTASKKPPAVTGFFVSGTTGSPVPPPGFPFSYFSTSFCNRTTSFA